MQDKILRRHAIKSITGLSRSTIYSMIVEGDFPKSIKLGKRAVGWRETAIADRLLKFKHQNGPEHAFRICDFTVANSPVFALLDVLRTERLQTHWMVSFAFECIVNAMWLLSHRIPVSGNSKLNSASLLQPFSWQNPERVVVKGKTAPGVHAPDYRIALTSMYSSGGHTNV